MKLFDACNAPTEAPADTPLTRTQSWPPGEFVP